MMSFLTRCFMWEALAETYFFLFLSQAFCWMVAEPWNDLPVNGNHACTAVELEPSIESMKNDHYAFITHSLGSRLVIDGLQRIAAIFSDKNHERRNEGDRALGDRFVKAFRELRIPIFMLANQLPLF